MIQEDPTLTDQPIQPEPLIQSIPQSNPQNKTLKLIIGMMTVLLILVIGGMGYLYTQLKSVKQAVNSQIIEIPLTSSTKPISQTPQPTTYLSNSDLQKKMHKVRVIMPSGLIDLKESDFDISFPVTYNLSFLRNDNLYLSNGHIYIEIGQIGDGTEVFGCMYSNTNTAELRPNMMVYKNTDYIQIYKSNNLEWRISIDDTHKSSLVCGSVDGGLSFGEITNIGRVWIGSSDSKAITDMDIEEIKLITGSIVIN